MAAPYVTKFGHSTLTRDGPCDNFSIENKRIIYAIKIRVFQARKKNYFFQTLLRRYGELKAIF